MENTTRKIILDTADADIILNLLEKKIEEEERTENLELDEISLQYLKRLRSFREKILAQISTN